MKALYKVADVLGEIAGNICIVAAFVMSGVVFLNVVLRLLFDSPILGSYEIVELIKSIAVFSGFIYAQKRKSYIYVAMILDHVPKIGKYISFALTSWFECIVAGLICVAAYQYGFTCIDSNSVTGVLNIPYAPFVFFECAMFAIFTFVLVMDAIKATGAIVSKTYREYVDSFLV